MFFLLHKNKNIMNKATNSKYTGNVKMKRHIFWAKNFVYLTHIPICKNRKEMKKNNNNIFLVYKTAVCFKHHTIKAF